jgi:hypothetical protein
MGTRNSTVVISKGKIKVAQYGQWDGYPSGVGVGVLKFLRNTNLSEFKKKVDSLELLTDEDVEIINKEIKAGNREFPEYHRDTAEGILTLIDEEKIWNNKIQPDSTITFNSLIGEWCEWSYIIDLDENTLTVLGHCPDTTYQLDNLPTDDELTKLGEDDEY